MNDGGSLGQASLRPLEVTATIETSRQQLAATNWRPARNSTEHSPSLCTLPWKDKTLYGIACVLAQRACCLSHDVHVVCFLYHLCHLLSTMWQNSHRLQEPFFRWCREVVCPDSFLHCTRTVCLKCGTYAELCNVPTHTCSFCCALCTHAHLAKFFEIFHHTVKDITMKWEPTRVYTDLCEACLSSEPKLTLTMKGVPPRHPCTLVYSGTSGLIAGHQSR